MLMLLIRLYAILILSTFWANYILLKPGAYTPTLKNIKWLKNIKKKTSISKSLRTTVLEEQAIWRGTNCYVKISHQFESFSNLHGSTVS